MAIELIPYSDFEEPRELAQQLHEAVVDNRLLLGQRRLFGPTLRYGGDLDTATENVEKGQREHRAGILGHFAVIGDYGDVVGSASIYPDLRLRRLRLPIPAGLAFGRLAVKFDYATPNIHGWLGYDEGNLTDLYSQLLRLSRDGVYHKAIGEAALLRPWHNGSAWTVEPSHSPHEIHRQIEASEIEKVATGRYDDSESKHKIPPKGTLYADIRFQWLSSIGKHRELMTGDKDFITEASDDITSRDPRGYS